jgi:hypothetical protein
MNQTIVILDIEFSEKFAIDFLKEMKEDLYDKRHFIIYMKELKKNNPK